MTRNEAINLFGWLKDSYPRNYAGADERRVATILDNLTRVFAQEPFGAVLDEYRRVYCQQKNEPHPSEILAGLRNQRGPVVRGLEGPDPEEIYAKLQKHPEYDQLVRIYGKLEVRRMALISTQFGTMAELKWRLMNEV